MLTHNTGGLQPCRHAGLAWYPPQRATAAPVQPAQWPADLQTPQNRTPRTPLPSAQHSARRTCGALRSALRCSPYRQGRRLCVQRTAPCQVKATRRRVCTLERVVCMCAAQQGCEGAQPGARCPVRPCAQHPLPCRVKQRAHLSASWQHAPYDQGRRCTAHVPPPPNAQACARAHRT